MAPKTVEPERIVEKSEALSRAAAALLPAGLARSALTTATVAREAEQPAPPAYLAVFAKAKGSVLIDIDGNEYIDYFGAHGALILGHADERVVAAVSKATSKGCAFGVPSEFEIRLAELIVGRFRSVEMVVLVDTSADALACALLLAHLHTRRDRIVRFEGYVSNADDPALTVQVPYNDSIAVERLFHDYGSTIAAVVVEPVSTVAGLITPMQGFLETLRTLCDAHGALLIFDETVTGFRLASGGAAAAYDIAPDLTLLGTTIGGGLPVAACGGRKEIMQLAGSDAFVSGKRGAARTSYGASTNLLGMAAGIATMQAVGEPGFHDALGESAGRLAEGLRAAAANAGIPTYQTRAASMLGMFFTEQRIVNAQAARRCNTAQFAAYHKAMLDRGILLPPSPFSCIFVSAAHTADEIDRTIEAARQALAACRET